MSDNELGTFVGVAALGFTLGALFLFVMAMQALGEHRAIEITPSLMDRAEKVCGDYPLDSISIAGSDTVNIKCDDGTIFEYSFKGDK